MSQIFLHFGQFYLYSTVDKHGANG